jgi:hypothetical protein
VIKEVEGIGREGKGREGKGNSRSHPPLKNPLGTTIELVGII